MAAKIGEFGVCCLEFGVVLYRNPDNSKPQPTNSQLFIIFAPS